MLNIPSDLMIGWKITELILNDKWKYVSNPITFPFLSYGSQLGLEEGDVKGSNTFNFFIHISDDHISKF